MSVVMNEYQEVKWYKKKPAELANLFPYIKTELKVFSTSGIGPLAPFALNLVSVRFVPQGFVYNVIDFHEVYGYEKELYDDKEVFVPFTDVYLLYATLRQYKEGDWTDVFMSIYELGQIGEWKDVIPDDLIQPRLKEGGQAKIFFSAMRTLVGCTKANLDIRVIGSVLVSSGSVYYLVARALVLLGKSGKMYLYDPNETAGLQTVSYGISSIEIHHVKRKIQIDDHELKKADVVLDDAGVLVSGDIHAPFFSLKGARMMPDVMIEGQPFYVGSEYRTYKGIPMKGYRHYLGLDGCSTCIQIGRLANSLSHEEWFGPWLVLAFAYLGIVPCSPFPGVQDIIEKGRMFREVSLKKTVDLRSYDVILQQDPSVKWRAALSLLLDGDVRCGGPDKLTILAGQQFFLTERRVRPCKIVQHAGPIALFLMGKKVFIHDVVSRELDGIVGSVPQDADVIVAENFPPTRSFKCYPKFWLSPKQVVQQGMPYVYRTAFRGRYDSMYLFEYEDQKRRGQNVLDVLKERVGKNLPIDEQLIVGVREGPELLWHGTQTVIMVGKTGDMVPCVYAGNAFKLISGTCELDDVLKLAVYLAAKSTDGYVIPRLLKCVGNFHYFLFEAEDVAMVFRDDLADRALLDFYPRVLDLKPYQVDSKRVVLTPEELRQADMEARTVDQGNGGSQIIYAPGFGRGFGVNG